MFGKRFAYEFEGSEQGWTPPWLRDERREPRHFGPPMPHMRHGHHSGPFGPQQEGWTPPWAQEEFRGPHFFGMRRGRGPFGHGGPFGPGGDGPRFFGRGDMKFALLALLQERPMHGYEMIKALEEKSGGFYTPSPGSIYPTLQLLEDRGLVTVNEVEGKKVYSITDAGQALLSERQGQEQHHHRQDGPEFGPPWMRHRGPGGNRFSPELQALRSEAMEVMRLLTIAGRMSFQDPEQLAKLRTIIEHTRNDLAGMIYGTQAGTNQSAPTAAPQQDGPTVENV
ncbi:MAG: PadR family transcriptional regulator [Ktedonobacteraceae bacterium]